MLGMVWGEIEGMGDIQSYNCMALTPHARLNVLSQQWHNIMLDALTAVASITSGVVGVQNTVIMAAQDENDAISTLTGLSLGNILTGLSLPSGSGLNVQLGLTGRADISQGQLFNDKWDDEDAVGAGQGEDFEDEVDLELRNEAYSEPEVKMETDIPITLPPKEKKTKIVKRLVERPPTVFERFPAFEKDRVLNFTELFKGYAPQKSRLSKRPFQVETVYPRKKDHPRNFFHAIVGDVKRQVENKRVSDVVSAGSIEHDLLMALQERENSDVAIDLPLHDRTFDLVLLSNWEDQIIYEPDHQSAQAPPGLLGMNTDLTKPSNKVLDSGEWTQSIIWSPDAPFRDFTQLEISPEDQKQPEEQTTDVVRQRRRTRQDAAQAKDKFNLSNDHYYEVSKDGRHRIRQTFGQLNVEHAYPAQKLQLPFYKTRLSKQEARAFHRPALQFPSNVELHFTKVRTAKKKKDRAGRNLGKGGNVAEGLHTTSDLSLRDTSNFVLWEFSEEHPPIVQNFGMGSVLVNYYRKKTEKDEHIPKYDLGVPFVLEPQDESPFMKFGLVRPGQTIPALYNNLIRAPLFRHKAYPTDFLIIRSTIKGEAKYYIREIKNLFVVGQTYPVTEVPGPHSRKITNTIKYRLQIIAFKLLRKSQGERLKISRLMKYFPDQNELQMRQRLKEFMEYHRRGPHQGFWRLKPNLSIPSDAEMLKMVVPESVVLMESMQVGQRHLQDSGYGMTTEAAAEEDDESSLSIEQQLAPWITTKNFLHATQAKAMLRLHGDGDPTGRGEAFSFIRISMKDIFVRAGEDYESKLLEAENRPKSAHRYNVAEQQQIYKSEIERIWNAQFDSLSRKDEPELTAEDIRRYEEAEQEINNNNKKARGQSQTRQGSLRPDGMDGAILQPSPSVSRASSVERGREGSMGPDSNRKVLRIKRLIDGEWRTEIIRDPAVIRAYVKNRQVMEEEATLTDTLAPTGDADRDKRARKRLEEEIARMRKNQERRLHRKNAKIVKEGGTPLQLNRPIKPDTTRRCGHCGQMGHMKTNRKCPKWAESNMGVAPVASSSNTATSPPPPGTPISALGFNRAGLGAGPAVPSPLATSPPMSALEMDREEGGIGAASTASGATAAPKLKLTLKKG